MALVSEPFYIVRKKDGFWCILSGKKCILLETALFSFKNCNIKRTGVKNIFKINLCMSRERYGYQNESYLAADKRGR